MSPNHRIREMSKFNEAIRRVRHFIPFRLWPVRFYRLFFRQTTLAYCERFIMACFLLGNGVRLEDAWRLLKHRWRDKAARMHMQSLFATIMRGDRDHKWTYYNVRECDMLTLAGEPYSGPRDLAVLTRPINTESRRVWRIFCESSMRRGDR